MHAGQSTAARQVVRIEGPGRQVMAMYESREGKERKTMEIVHTRAK